MSRRDIVGAIVLVVLFVVLLVTLYFTMKPAGPNVGFDNNFIVQQRVRIQNQNQQK